MVEAVKVRTPASAANLGPGFDCMGAALTLYNEFCFSLLPDEGSLDIDLKGIDVVHLTTDADNLAYKSFKRLYDRLGKKTPGVKIEIDMEIPLTRGLGSSATAIVAGLVAANHLAESPLSQTELMELAIAIEGFPDNVVPALLGGCHLATKDESGWLICDIPWHETIIPVVAIPNFELSTADARRILPSGYDRQDAIFNISHIGLLVRGLETGNPEWLKRGMEDRIHQPYRKTLIPGYDEVKQAAIEAGALGVAISGAGPTLIAFVNADRGTEVGTAMVESWKTHGIHVDALSLMLDRKGTTVETVELE
ncbi:homoserine kinase [Roseofilum sp. Belize Diploria]|uniref:homoserine kinase n=1 Tax=Roseofilum sp. Belize Diploria TaxID=2821501 RepID=UPI000E857670|nr:homoserine kinase [Roseofilum sp. Belize Diploria]MBP0010670.1 homoserine kinase [Roseofilum sp. Belize Diploria]HBR00977.1 homoserine kinase [Cyanobacteria bacterium UBA11691]